MNDVRVVVVDDQQLIRESIAALLDLQPGITVVGTAGDGRVAVEVVGERDPDVVLMDVRMPVLDGIGALGLLRGGRAKVVMLTTFDDEEYVVRALQGGASGYLLKDRPVAELAAAVRLAHSGVVQFDPAAAARLASAVTSGRPDGLTEREVDVLRLAATGRTNREIAGRLHVSEGTVKNHVSRILGRLGLRDRTQAAVYARDRGLL